MGPILKLRHAIRFDHDNFVGSRLPGPFGGKQLCKGKRKLAHRASARCGFHVSASGNNRGKSNSLPKSHTAFESDSRIAVWPIRLRLRSTFGWLATGNRQKQRAGNCAVNRCDLVFDLGGQAYEVFATLAPDPRVRTRHAPVADRGWAGRWYADFSPDSRITRGQSVASHSFECRIHVLVVARRDPV